MLTYQPNNFNNTDNMEATMKYLYLCNIEIFLDVFHYDYIVAAIFDTDISEQDLYGHI